VPKIDPRSDRIALHYTGSEAGEPAIAGVPARDLTENDVARLIYVDHGTVLTGAAYQNAVDKKLDELRDGPYRSTDPDAKPKAQETPPAKPSGDTPKEDVNDG
jgi:hypothetical protein